MFTHFENKVLKSIWLTLKKPGFITKENLRGVRVPYAKPVQLFIVVNLIFYLFVSYLHRTDYTPTIGDGSNSWVSGRPGLHWLRPMDSSIAVQLKGTAVYKMANYDTARFAGPSFNVHRIFFMKDSFAGYSDITYRQMFLNNYDQRVSVFSKTLIFLLIPVFAIILFCFFPRRLKYFGSALNLSTHFLVFNLLFYILLFAVSSLPYKWFAIDSMRGLPFKAIKELLYNPLMHSFSKAVFGLYEGFEALHIIFWGTWLFIAFRRLFQLHWLINILASYVIARLFFILVFCFYKKLLIAITLWTM